MSSLRRLARRFWTFLRPGHAERELAREIESHLALLEDDFRRHGLSAAAARDAARRAFGGVDQAKEHQRDARSFRWLEDARRDVGYAWRTLRRTPRFTFAAVVTIALGVGTVTTIFSLIDAVALKPLPYPQPDALVRVTERVPSMRNAGVPSQVMTVASFTEWRSRTRAFSHMAACSARTPAAVSVPSGTVQLSNASVSPSLFPMLGVGPLLGRVFTEADERPGSDAVLLSAAAWRQHFGADPHVVGRTLVVGGLSRTVVGVMPPSFGFPVSQTAFWMPFTIAPPRPNQVIVAQVLARLREDVPIEAAIAEGRTIGTARQFEVRRWRDVLLAPARPALVTLAWAAVIVLLVVSANIANLLLARGTGRRREIAVRLALGAGRGRIVRQLLTESVVLAVAGGVFATGLAYAAVQALHALARLDVPELFQLAARIRSGDVILPRLDNASVDLRVLGFALVCSVVTALVFGVVPALRAVRISLPAAMAGDATATRDARRSRRVGAGSVLAAMQVALATVLLVGAGLLIQSFARLSSVDAGFDAAHVLTFQLVVPPQLPAPRRADIVDAVVDRLSRLPQVRAAGFTNIPPLLGAEEFAGVLVPPGRSLEEMLKDPLRPQTRAVSPRYLPAIGARLLEGRWLQPADERAAGRVLLVNRALARRYFGTTSPVGAIVDLRRGDAPTSAWRIVGVVDDVRQARLDEEPYPIGYMLPRQMMSAFAGVRGGAGNPLGFMSVAVRVSGDPGAVASDVRAAVRAADALAGLDQVTTMQQLVSASVVRPRFYAVASAVFALVTGVLAIVGIYAVLAHAVSQRTREMAIRVALGAHPREVVRLILGQGLVVTAAGLSVGVAVAAGVTRSLTSLLFEVSPLDPGVFAAVMLAFTATAMLASYVPARRATRVDPATTLRAE